jgi:hypothetical protein
MIKGNARTGYPSRKSDDYAGRISKWAGKGKRLIVHAGEGHSEFGSDLIPRVIGNKLK